MQPGNNNFRLRLRSLTSFALAGLLTSTAAWAASPAEQGELLATKGATGVLACATCHGAQGQGMAAFPYLAGQGEAYLARQLGEFASGTRNNPVMGPIAKAMSAEQITAASAYYAQLPPAFNRQTLGLHMDTYPTKGDDGAWLAPHQCGRPMCCIRPIVARTATLTTWPSAFRAAFVTA